MAGNSQGKVFTVTTFGESHGPGLGCIVDGCPPGLALSAEDIQSDIERRRTGRSRNDRSRCRVPGLFLLRLRRRRKETKNHRAGQRGDENG